MTLRLVLHQHLAGLDEIDHLRFIALPDQVFARLELQPVHVCDQLLDQRRSLLGSA